LKYSIISVRQTKFVFREYVNKHDVSSEQPRPVRWWKMQL